VNSVSGETADADDRAYLEEVYRSRQHSDGTSIEHPLAVARLLHDDGQPETVVRAGLLHDVLEDTEVTTAEVRERFGREVARLVEALTQDPAIADYDRRKAALREQVLAAGRDAATVALADKAAKLANEPERPQQARLDHNRATLEGIEQRFGPSPLSERLRAELERFSD
jgi:(p)ppGpp synthase/HD superfamily hydrolase